MSDKILDDVQRDTAMARARLIVTNALRNMATIEALPYVVGTMHFVGDVAICGAGPSLDETAGMLARQPNATVIAVNGAWRTLRDKGVEPSAVICIESLDVSEQLDGWTGRVILDWTAHPNVYDKALANGCEAFWFADSSPYSVRYVGPFGFIPINVGPSAVTAATDIAYKCGASRVILVGIDSCYPNGKAYAKDSPWGKLSVKRRGDKLVFPPNPKRDALHRSGGVPPIPEVRRRIVVNGLDTTAELYAQLDWFREYMSKTKRDIRIASPYMRQALSGDKASNHSVSKVRAGTVVVVDNGERAAWLDAQVRREANAARDLANDFEDGVFDELTVSRLEQNHGLQLIQTLALSDTMRLRRNPSAKRQAKLVGTYTILAAAADKALELIEY